MEFIFCSVFDQTVFGDLQVQKYSAIVEYKIVYKTSGRMQKEMIASSLVNPLCSMKASKEHSTTSSTKEK
jgi:hypothetical protein